MLLSSNKNLTPFFWLSLFLHAVLLFFILVTIIFSPSPEILKKPPQYYVPSYVYTGGITPHVTTTQTASSRQQTHQQKKQGVKKETAPLPLTSLPHHADYQGAQKPARKESIFASSMQMLQQDQIQSLQAKKSADPIYLIGDMSQAADPLIKLIGKALSAHFRYPDTPGRLGIKGRALVGLTLHPGGYFTDVSLLESSQNHELDDAALYAVNQAPLVAGADRFINHPKHFVIGFIFY